MLEWIGILRSHRNNELATRRVYVYAHTFHEASSLMYTTRLRNEEFIQSIATTEKELSKSTHLYPPEYPATKEDLKLFSNEREWEAAE